MPKLFIHSAILLTAGLTLPVLFASDADALLKKNKRQAIEIKCKITVTDSEGKSQIITSPTVVTYLGVPASVEINQKNGERIKVELSGTHYTESNVNPKITPSK